MMWRKECEEIEIKEIVASEKKLTHETTITSV
jgi:hypothetical protein